MFNQEKELQYFAEYLRKTSEETFGTPEQNYRATCLYFEIARTPVNSLSLFDRYFDICEADISEWNRERLLQFLGSKIA